MEEKSIWASLKTLIDPKTIPFLISQGVGPKLFPVGTFLLGMILAFIWAYVVSPTVNVGSGPVNLSDSWKQEYVKQVAWQMQAAGGSGNQDAVNNAQNQLKRLGNAKEVLDETIAANQTDPQLAPLLQALKPIAVDNPDELGKVSPGLLNGNFTPILCILGAAIIFGGAVIVNTIIPVTLLFQRRSKEAPTVVSGQDKLRRDAEAKAKQAAAAAPQAPSLVERGTPVGQYMSTYIMGDDLYDDSFSIETASGEFLGETGAGISKTIGVGDPKKVTAVEVWVFDKNDIRTVTKVLMSEHAFNDEGIKAELAPKGEAVLVKAGTIVLLETQTLTVQGRVVDLAYGTGALPPNSFFDRITVEISAWPKKAPAGAPAAGGAFGDTAVR
ncbi:MAG TPA: hypothetical protein VKQ72_04125 [Aggregatilineales bacterium]|nr:hypothetical protein [Aggregatilineales bacterium]